MRCRPEHRLVTRELSEQLQHAWEQYRSDLEFEALTRNGYFDDVIAESPLHEEQDRWGLHLLEHYSDPDYDEHDDPGPPPLAPLLEHRPVPF